MKESHYRKFMAGMYLLLLGIFGWVVYQDHSETWWREIVAIVLCSAVYFWVVRKACDISRRHGGFAPVASSASAASAQKH